MGKKDLIWEPYEDYILRKKWLAARLLIGFGLMESSYEWGDNPTQSAKELLEWYNTLPNVTPVKGKFNIMLGGNFEIK